MTSGGREKIGVIGLGTMGGAVALRLLSEGHALTIFDLDDAAMQRVSQATQKGVYLAKNVAELAKRSSVVLCSFAHPDVLLDVIAGENGLKQNLSQGSIVVDLSTSGPEVARKCGAILQEVGCEMVDATIARGPAAALRGELIFMIGGSPESIDRVEPVLNSLASKIVRCGPLGAGQVIKLANNLVACANLAVISEAYGLVKSYGCDPKLLLSVMQGTYADSFQLQHSVANKAINGNFDIVFRLDLAAKDMHLARQASVSQNVSSAFSDASLEWYNAAIAAGRGKLDWSAVLLVADPALEDSKPNT